MGRGDQPGVQLFGARGAGPRIDALHGGSGIGRLPACVVPAPDLKYVGAASGLRSAQLGIEDDELPCPEGGVFGRGVLVVLLRVVRAHDLDREARRDVARLPGAQAREVVGPGRRRLDEGDVGIDADARVLLEPPAREVAGDVGVAAGARDEGEQDQFEKANCVAVRARLGHVFLREHPGLFRGRYVEHQAYGPGRGAPRRGDMHALEDTRPRRKVHAHRSVVTARGRGRGVHTQERGGGRGSYFEIDRRVSSRRAGASYDHGARRGRAGGLAGARRRLLRAPFMPGAAPVETRARILEVHASPTGGLTPRRDSTGPMGELVMRCPGGRESREMLPRAAARRDCVRDPRGSPCPTVAHD